MVHKAIKVPLYLPGLPLVTPLSAIHSQTVLSHTFKTVATHHRGVMCAYRMFL